MKRPFFTIIIVAYNAGKKLDNTLDSVLAQSFSDYHILIKDGGSTDGSIERAISKLKIDDSGSSKDCKYRLIKGKDHGIYDAMNIAVQSLKDRKCAAQSAGDEPGYVYFLNCGDSFSDENVLEKLHRFIIGDIKKRGTTLPAIYYGDIFEIRTGQRVSSVPKINDFACYRNVPSHQACFYDERLMQRYAFDTVWKVRADYEHFLRCVYVEKAGTVYTKLLIADYEGGGFSETKENRKVSETERRQIIHLYLSSKQIKKYDLIRTLTLAPIRTKIAQNPKTAGFYNFIKRIVYSIKKNKS